ncbi:unnamed protein product [Rotaria magnacalcarata]|uniref:Pentapeptide repeat-containing protein n=1 Tax=Rotaria magnacalcarata TaxID=392030 RepID=A0A816V7F2_9BILA|nr:unnamed protein product [Rotaria magnacalcarata]
MRRRTLLIAVATIIVTIQQNELNKANRANDLEIAQKQREQDLYISNQTREPGRELNARQRQQEQFLADQQRQESLVDNYTREVINLEMKDASFQGASLLSAQYDMANLTNAKFANTDLRLADFSLTDQTGSDLSDKQWYEQILTLQDVILPDGIIHGRAPN